MNTATKEVSVLTDLQTRVHNNAIRVARQYHSDEVMLIEILKDVERLKVYKQLGMRSLFQYATECLNLDEAAAYMCIAVARKAVVIPELQSAISNRSLTVSKANRIVAHLKPENALELIEFARTHSKSELEKEIARRNPKAKTRDRIKVLSDEWAEMKGAVSMDTLEKFKRVESLLAQKNKDFAFDPLLNEVLSGWLEKNDPVKKAERAQARLEASKARVVEKPDPIMKLNPKSTIRVPLTAAQVHAVFARDQGKCTHLDIHGRRCNSDRWIQVHHIIEVSKGGTNESENLTTLCSFHHDLVHQLSLPMEGQVTWLRSPSAVYASSKTADINGLSPTNYSARAE